MPNSSATVDAHERKRDFLTETEIEKLLDAARAGRHGFRDWFIIFMMYRHGLRVSELCRMKIEDFDESNRRIWIERLKGSLSTWHPLPSDELRAIRKWLRTRTDTAFPEMFISERAEPFQRQSINYIIRRAGETAKLSFRVYPHMLRHSCGYSLGNKGYDTRLIQDYLGHRNSQHTARYTRTAAERFMGLWYQAKC